VLRDVSLSLASGQVVALLGPNGSGKSTLIKVLLGHLRGQGHIAWEGRDIGSWSHRQLARHVAYLPQSPAFDQEAKIGDVLRLGRAPYWLAFGLESQRDLEIVARVSRLLDLGDLLDRRMDEISGGQRQRVFLGRCLAQEPRALLLDEPNTFLDLRHQVELCRLLRDLAGRDGMGILMASHDLNMAATFADHLVILKDGAVAAQGPPGSVLHREILSDVFGLKMELLKRPGNKAPVIIPEM